MIESKSLKIVPFSAEFVGEKYLSWLNDKDVMRFSEQRHRSHNNESCMNYLKSFDCTPNFLGAIFTKDSNIFIGNINTYVDINNKVGDVGILIGDVNFSGRGYGLEAWCAVIYYLFESKALRKVTGGTMELNLPMLKIMSKSGMKEEGRKKKQYLVEGKEVDLIQVAIFKEEFEKLKEKSLYSDVNIN